MNINNNLLIYIHVQIQVDWLTKSRENFKTNFQALENKLFKWEIGKKQNAFLVNAFDSTSKKL